MNDPKIKMLTTKRIHCDKCPNTEFFLVRIFLFRIEYGDLRSKSPYSVRKRENTDQRKLRIFEHFSRSDNATKNNPCFTFSSVYNIID